MSALLSVAPTVAFPLYSPNAHLICPLSQPSCLPLLLIPHHLHPLHVQTFHLSPVSPRSELCIPPSTGTLTRLLAVLCIWHQRDPYVDAVPQGTCTLTRFPLDHPELTMPALGCPMMHCLAREQPSGDLHAAQITLSPPPPPISACYALNVPWMS